MVRPKRRNATMLQHIDLLDKHFAEIAVGVGVGNETLEHCLSQSNPARPFELRL
jgi:hypothetical protein